MKIRLLVFSAVIFLTQFLSAQSLFDKAVKTVQQTVATPSSPLVFSEAEAAEALREAMRNGIRKGVQQVNVTDGYFKNPQIKIPFPPQAAAVENTLRSAGMNKLADDVVLSCNRAAEQAADAALPIFADAITKLTIQDAIQLVKSKEVDAATRLLERTTTEPLVSAFRPSVQKALDATYATRYWKQATSYYNRLPLVKKVNTDLTDFVTRKAVAGLFVLIAKEEAQIRRDPAARVSDLLQRVFGSIKP